MSDNQLTFNSGSFSQSRNALNLKTIVNDIMSMFQYIIEHYEKFLLLLLVVVIVFLVEYISYLNVASTIQPSIISSGKNKKAKPRKSK